MRVIIEESNLEKEIKFPCLMEYPAEDGSMIIIIATGFTAGKSAYRGFIIQHPELGALDPLGVWNIGFKPCNYPVTLIND